MISFLRISARAVPLLLVLFLSCKKDSPVEPTGPTATTGLLSGRVSESGTGLDVVGAAVVLSIQSQTYNTTSGAGGNYNVIVNMADSTAAGTITVSANGYLNANRLTTLTRGATRTENFSLVRDTSTTPQPPTPGGGYVNTVAYVGPPQIGLAVYGVGGKESAVITFEARDSLGYPITASKADTMSFAITGTPVLGGAYITPGSAITNASGRAATVIQSGSVSGSIQIEATLRRDEDGQIIRSTPVKVLVYGGLPDQTHFGLGASPYNIPGYYKIGEMSTITALVGDKYGNPVAPGTAVYFGNPQQGLITTSTGFTTEAGFANVTLYTGVNHAPNGLGYVYAQTLGANGTVVGDSILILFSGNAYVDVSGVGALVVDDITQYTVNFNVWDERNNPLAKGTTISSSIEGASAIASDPSPTSTLEDVVSASWTNFTIVVSKNKQAVPVVTGPFTLTITVSGPNGKASGVITGVVN